MPIHEDIRKLDGSKIDADVIVGGYPCQPFSHAGKRSGEEDDRHLWPEMYRLIKAIRPRWVIAENVAGHITMGLDAVLSDLEAVGYAWWTFVIPACAVDAKHRRNRVWIIAYSGLPESQGRQEPQRNNKGSGEEGIQEGSESASSCSDVADNDSCNSGTSRSHQIEGRPTNLTKPRGQSGFWRAWPVEPSVGGMVDGLSAWLDGLISKDEALRILREIDDSASLEEWELGFNFCEEKILLKHLLRELHHGEKSETIKGRGEKASSEAVEKSGTMPTMPEQRESPAASQGQGHSEQLTGELGNPLPEVPHSGPHERRELGCIWYEEEVPRVAVGIPERVSRLKGLGNAVVPQIPEMIGYAILDSLV